MTCLMLPIAEYSRSEGIAVIGGYVYRGPGIPALTGSYVSATSAQETFGASRKTIPALGSACFY
jgi:hypothetical protein